MYQPEIHSSLQWHFLIVFWAFEHLCSSHLNNPDKSPIKITVWNYAITKITNKNLLLSD